MNCSINDYYYKWHFLYCIIYNCSFWLECPVLKQKIKNERERERERERDIVRGREREKLEGKRGWGVCGFPLSLEWSGLPLQTSAGRTTEVEKKLKHFWQKWRGFT